METITSANANGVLALFTYDALNRLTELSMPPIADYKYTLGATGNRTNATEQSGRALTWSYDGIYRLTNETISGDPANNGGNNGSAAYQLDPVGNRTSASSTFSGFSPVAGSYNAADQLSSETYDANGNTTLAANGNSYTYDSQNHMLTATGSGKTITMVYDAFGNRVGKTVNGVMTWYLVEDDVNPTGLPQVLEEKVGGAVERVYTYGLQRISQYQFFDNQWTASFYVYDGAGSVRQLADSNGTPTDEYEYDAYGNSFTKQGTTPNNYLYRGEQFDSDLGLYYLRARYYNPTTGRFLTRDPQSGHPILPMSLQKYLYASGNPVNRIDPRGQEALIENTLVISEKSLPTVEYLNTIGCYANITLTATATILSEQLGMDTAVGVAGAIYGCVTTSWSPVSKIMKWVKTGIDVGFCLAGLVSTINDENDYLKNPTGANEAKFILDDINSVLGCGLTGIGAALEH
jgi:RHS repeat-associated protein